MDSDTLVPLFAIVFIFGAPVAAWIVTRVLAHQERMEMLRHGIVPPPSARDMRRATRGGWTPGTPQMAAQFCYDGNFYPQQQLRRGIQVAFIGFALLIGLSFIGFHDGRLEVGPWLLGGLIPLFVGVAQIVGAVLSGATAGPAAARQSFGPAAAQPPPNNTAAPSAASGPTYGGWRPGPIPEIEKPTAPPDYRS
jgi:hypothetical protein